MALGARRRAGEAGARNDRYRIKAYFDLGLSPFRMFGRGLKLWAKAELDAVRLRLKSAGPARNQSVTAPPRSATAATEA